MFKKRPVIVLSAAALALMAAFAFQHGNFIPITPSHAVTSQSQPTETGRALPDFSALVDQAGPAVVNISVVHKVPTAGANPETAEKLVERVVRVDPGHLRRAARAAFAHRADVHDGRPLLFDQLGEIGQIADLRDRGERREERQEKQRSDCFHD